MNDLSNIEYWKKAFGLLPIQLKNEGSQYDYILLNGSQGDFCLQSDQNKSELREYNSKSWSSNTKNYVELSKNKVTVHNWLTGKVESLSQKDVKGNIKKFYNYLLQTSYKSEQDVVPFFISLFRKFRNITSEKTNPLEALNLLFVLLANIESKGQKLNLKTWKLLPYNLPVNFDQYIELVDEINNNINPDLELILRHAS